MSRLDALPQSPKGALALERDAITLAQGRELLSALHPSLRLQGETLLLALGRAVDEVHQSLYAPVDLVSWAVAEQRRYQARSAGVAFVRALPV